MPQHGVPEMVIQRILRHANVSTTATYYIKTAADDVLRCDVEAGKQPTCPEILNGHLGDTKRACDTSVGRHSVTFSMLLRDWDCGTSGGEGGIRTPDTAFDRITV